MSKTKYIEKIDEERLAYGTKGEKKFHKFLKKICGEMKLTVEKHPHGVKQVDFIISDPESEKNLLVEVERRKIEKWVNKFPYDAVDFYLRRDIRKNCLEFVLNDLCTKALVYSHDVIENYKVERFYCGIESYYSRRIDTKHSKEFSLLKDVDKIKDLIYNGMNGNLNNLNLNNRRKADMSKETNTSEALALAWIKDNLSLAAQYCYYYRQINSFRLKKSKKYISPPEDLLQSISQVYKDNNEGSNKSQKDVEEIIINNWKNGAGFIADEIVNTISGGSNFLADREKYGFVVKKYTNTFVSIWLLSVDVKNWWESSIGTKDPIGIIKGEIENYIKDEIENSSSAEDESTIAENILLEKNTKESDIQNSIVKNLSDTPKTSASISKEAFELMGNINPILGKYSKESIKEAFDTMYSWQN